MIVTGSSIKIYKHISFNHRFDKIFNAEPF